MTKKIMIQTLYNKICFLREFKSILINVNLKKLNLFWLRKLLGTTTRHSRISKLMQLLHLLLNWWSSHMFWSFNNLNYTMNKAKFKSAKIIQVRSLRIELCFVEILTNSISWTCCDELRCSTSFRIFSNWALRWCNCCICCSIVNYHICCNAFMTSIVIWVERNSIMQ